MEVRDDETNTIASQAVMGADWNTSQSLYALYHLGYPERGLWDDSILRHRLYHALSD